MQPSDIIDRVLAISDREEREAFLESHLSELDDETAQAFKDRADAFLRSDIRRSLSAAEDLLYQAALTRDPKQRALGLLAKANARSIGQSRYEDAIALYNEAAQIYESEGLIAEQARSRVGKVAAMAFLDRYDEAEADGLWAREILQEHGEVAPLATLTMNLASMYAYRGLDAKALQFFDEARDLYERLGPDGEQGRLWVEHNRAVILRNLGDFDAAIQAGHNAHEQLIGLGQTIAAAKAKQNLAMTYFSLGEFNQALKLLDEVREAFSQDLRQRDAALVDLFTTDCLLQLRRFQDVLVKCRQVKEHFSTLGSQRFVGQAMLNEAVALNNLGRHTEALQSLSDARDLFEDENNPTFLAIIDLERAATELRLGHAEPCVTLSLQCAETFANLSLSVEQAQSMLVAAKAELALGKKDSAEKILYEVIQIENGLQVPSLAYQVQHLMGRLQAQKGSIEPAIQHLEQAIQILERVSGHLMLEFRAGFIEDKSIVYEDAVRLCLDHRDPETALRYVERARSRALLDLLAYRLNLGVHAQAEADQPLVDQLNQIRAERDRLYRRWESDEEAREGGEPTWKDEAIAAQRKILDLEENITQLWHRLLIRNADYASQAALWTIQTEPVQQYLDPGTMLVEYYILDDSPLVFLVTNENIRAKRLRCERRQVQKPLELLHLNMKSVPRSSPPQMPQLLRNAQLHLRELHNLLLEPISGDVSAFERLIIVPHGFLHYVPFHALYDGHTYTLARHQVSYLPSASLLRYCLEAQPSGEAALALAYSSGGRLPNAVEEARAVAEITHGQAIVESHATKSVLMTSAESSQILHLAAHGDFRADNPLFSGLALADGWLSTLDIFGLRLQASLATLSACQTGRSVIGGGDELLGLMRAFLAAGVPSLLLTLWTVEDRSTAKLMAAFYKSLKQGRSRAGALRMAQRAMIQGHKELELGSTHTFKHPYFWAPFFLLGNPGQLERSPGSLKESDPLR